MTHLCLTQLLFCGALFQKGDPLQDGPEHDAQREDVCLSCVGLSPPDLRSHVEVRATRGRKVLPAKVTGQRALSHFAEAEVCHLKEGHGVKRSLVFNFY